MRATLPVDNENGFAGAQGPPANPFIVDQNLAKLVKSVQMSPVIVPMPYIIRKNWYVSAVVIYRRAL